MSSAQKQTMPKQIQTVMLTNKVPDDRPILQKINELSSVMPGMTPKNALKNFLARMLPIEIERLRKSGGQLLAG